MGNSNPNTATKIITDELDKSGLRITPSRLALLEQVDSPLVGGKGRGKGQNIGSWIDTLFILVHPMAQVSVALRAGTLTKLAETWAEHIPMDEFTALMREALDKVKTLTIAIQAANETDTGDDSGPDGVEGVDGDDGGNVEVPPSSTPKGTGG